MISIVALILLIWSLIFMIARFFQYYRIVNEYKEQTKANVIKVTKHIPVNKKEPPAVDVILSYTIRGKEGHSEITVPVKAADRYTLGTELDICYKVSGNGAVHVASAGPGARKMMYAYVGGIILVLIAFVVIWFSMF